MKIGSNLATAVTFGMVSAALFGCSNPPTQPRVIAGTAGASGGSGTAGTSGGAGAGGGAGTQGGAGNSGGTGGAGASGATGGAGLGAAGTTAPDGGAGSSAGTGGGGAGSTACGACPTGVIGHCDPSATYPTYPGFTLALAEDFCGALDLDHDPVWTWSDGAPADGDTWFDKSQITFSNGKMLITAIKQTIPAGYTSYAESDYNSATGKPTGRHFLSGELRTKYNNYRYGRYEVSFKAPVAVPTSPNLGGYLATMFTFRTPKWLTWNEVDLELEPINSSMPALHKIAGNVVDLVNPGAGVPGYPDGASFLADPMVPTYVQTDFHTYAFEWTAAGVNWFLDGKMIHNYAGGTGNGGPMPKLPSLSAKIMMNMWVFFGTAFGDPTPNVYPLVAQYDSFHFYQAAGETYPCSPTPSCLSAGDTKFSQNNKNETPYP
jgi:beta-glucanase (GH16 family)